MSSIHKQGGPSRPHTPEPAPAAPVGEGERADSSKLAAPPGISPTPTTPPTSPKRPQVQHTRSEPRVPRSPPRPAPAATATRTSPPTGQATVPTSPMEHQLRIDTMRSCSAPEATHSPEGLRALEPLQRLLRHDEGLKVYFVHLGFAGTFMACQTHLDASRMAPAAGRSRAPGAGGLAEHRDLLQSLIQLTKANAKVDQWAPLVPPAETPPSTSATSSAVTKAISKAFFLRRSFRNANNPQEHLVQGGTRFRLQQVGLASRVTLEPSGVYGYDEPDAASLAVLANFYANVLVAEAQGGEPLRCEVGEVSAGAMPTVAASYPKLAPLAAAINAAVDRALATVPDQGPAPGPVGSRTSSAPESDGAADA